MLKLNKNQFFKKILWIIAFLINSSAFATDTEFQTEDEIPTNFVLVGYDACLDEEAGVLLTREELERLKSEVSGNFNKLLRKKMKTDKKGRIVWSKLDHQTLKNIAYFFKNNDSTYLTLGKICSCTENDPAAKLTLDKLRIACEGESLTHLGDMIDGLREISGEEIGEKVLSTRLVCSCNKKLDFYDFDFTKDYVIVSNHEGKLYVTVTNKEDKTPYGLFQQRRAIRCITVDQEQEEKTYAEAQTLIYDINRAKKAKICFVEEVQGKYLCPRHRISSTPIRDDS